MSLEIYTGATPNGWKITVMVEELLEAGADLPAVNYHTVSLGGEQFTPAFLAIHLVRGPEGRDRSVQRRAPGKVPAKRCGNRLELRAQDRRVDDV